MFSFVLLASAAAQCAAAGQMMQVVVTKFDAANPVPTLAVTNAAIPTPGKGQVLVRMSAMPVNPADMFSIMGVYPGFNQGGASKPVPGLEGGGVIAQLGPGSAAVLAKTDPKLAVGSKVVPFVSLEVQQKGAGTYAEYIIVEAENVVPVPEGVGMEAAAQHYVNPITAIGMLKELDAPKGEYVVQSAGGSTLGKQLVQIAKSMGLKTISTVRRCEQVEELKKYGADHVLCDPVEELTAKIKAITGEKGAWGAVDAVAGDMTAALQMATRPGGTVLVYGALAGLDFKGNVVGSLFMNVAIRGYWVTTWMLGMEPAERRAVMKQSLEYMRSGVVVPHTGKTFSLEKVKDAFAEANRPGRSSDGKAMLVTDEKCAQKLKAEL